MRVHGMFSASDTEKLLRKEDLKNLVKQASGNHCEECGEPFAEKGYGCQDCCDHEPDADEGYHCLMCGKDCSEGAMSAACDRAKDYMKYGE